VRAQGIDDPGADPRVRSRFSGAATFLNTQPLGELATGPGYGIGLSVAWAPEPTQRVRLRADLRVAGYGHETRRACLSETVGCLIEADINTVYSTVYVGAGPELAFPVLGSTLIFDATAGYAVFSVDSSIEGRDSDGSVLNTNNFRDGLFAWSAGGELRVPVSSQVAIALGARYQRNGRASYVPEGGIARNPDGSVAIESMTTEANQVALTLGVALHPFVGQEQEDGTRAPD
jgi:opacity protein-like surface antigen